MKWSEEETVKFVEMYRESECLWNIASPLYKDKNLRQKAIEAIVNDMKKDEFGVQEAKQKIKKIRSTFNQEMLKSEKINKVRRRFCRRVCTYLHSNGSLFWNR